MDITPSCAQKVSCAGFSFFASEVELYGKARGESRDDDYFSLLFERRPGWNHKPHTDSKKPLLA